MWSGTALPVFLLHWMTFGAVLWSAATGLRISADDPDNPLAQMISPLLPQGNVIQWHRWSALAVLFSALAYTLIRIAGRTKRSPVSSASLQRNIPLFTVKLLHWTLITLLGIAMLTGLGQYLDTALVSNPTLNLVHLTACWTLLICILIHIAVQLWYGGFQGFLRIFQPRASKLMEGAMAICVAALLVFALAWMDDQYHRPLWITAIDISPQIDGNPDDRVWRKARPVRIRTHHGANLPQGETVVTLRALHDRYMAYFLFSWMDPTRSMKHLPLLKTTEGWKVLQTEFYHADEDQYYEDKFALLLARSPGIVGNGSIHLGPKPLAGKPGSPGGRGLHYTRDGSIVDVWQWKSVRTGDGMGLMDDNHFGPPRAPRGGVRRYTGGYYPDPKETRGYVMNWQWYQDNLVVPRRLPLSTTLLPDRGEIDLDPNVSEQGQWWLPWHATRAYRPDADHYPVGTLLPSVLINDRIEGDRGDISARAQWMNGRWYLEVARNLDTDSKYDMPIEDGIFLWVSVFDHSQTRHSWHLRPVRIRMQSAVEAEDG